MGAFFLTLGLWRSWLGGGININVFPGKRIDALQYAVALLIAFLATWDKTWQITLIDGVGILALARWHGHGPMLQFIDGLADDPDGDWILTLVGGPGGGVPRYLAYEGIRYVIPAAIWSAALGYFGGAWQGPLAGSVGLCACYLAFTVAVSRGVTFPILGGQIGNQAANWSELTGFQCLGVALWLAG